MFKMQEEEREKHIYKKRKGVEEESELMGRKE